MYGCGQDSRSDCGMRASDKRKGEQTMIGPIEMTRSTLSKLLNQMTDSDQDGQAKD
jgi:hypothetical protein